MDKKKIVKLAKLGAAEKKRLAAKGRKAITVILAKKHIIEESFYEMGRAFAVLQDEGVVRALGYRSFDQLCNTKLKVSSSTAERLAAITEHFGANEAKKLMTGAKATAVIALANAIGGKTTARGLLTEGTVHLKDGQTIDVHSASAHTIEAAARRLRSRTNKPSTHGGRAVSADARRFFQRLHHALQAAKLDVRVDEIAASKSDGGKMRLTASVHDASKLGSALRQAANASLA